MTYRTTYRSYLPDPAGAAAAIQADLLAVGINAAVEGLDNNDFLVSYYSDDLDLFLIGWYVDYPHADSFYSILCQIQVASYGPFDDAFCGLLEDAEAEFDPQQQLSQYYQVGQKLYDDIPLLPIAHPREAVVLDASLAGFVPSLLGWEEFNDTYYAGAVQAVVAGGSDITLIYTDTLGSPTSVEVPAGAVRKRSCCGSCRRQQPVYRKAAAAPGIASN